MRDGRPAPTPHEPPHEPRLPAAPPLRRTYRPTPVRAAGLVLLTVLVAASLAGTFGPSPARAEATVGPLRIVVDHPGRTRARAPVRIEVIVENVGRERLDDVVVHLDRPYLTAVAVDSVEPGLAHLARDAVVAHLGSVPPGEGRALVVHGAAGAFGRAAGTVRATAGDVSAEVELVTLVFP